MLNLFECIVFVLPCDSLIQRFLQAPVAIVILFKVFFKFFSFPVCLGFYSFNLFILIPICSTVVSKGICLLMHLTGVRGR